MCGVCCVYVVCSLCGVLIHHSSWIVSGLSTSSCKKSNIIITDGLLLLLFSLHVGRNLIAHNFLFHLQLFRGVSISLRSST